MLIELERSFGVIDSDTAGEVAVDMGML